MQRLPEHFKPYFWDVDWNDLNGNIDKFRSFVVTRLADKGDVEHIRWLKEQVGYDQVSEIVGESRQVSEKTRRFWKHAKTFL